MGLIAEALATIGGVPAKALADRMACLKGGVVANVAIPTPDYVRFATHDGFAPDFRHANDPQSKGVVENLVGYAQRDLAVPLFTEAAVAGITVDVHAANAAAKIWCAEVNARVHSETCAVPEENLESERELLSALPSLRLEIGPPPVTRKVDRLSCVRFASARYSVPVRFIGTTVMLTQVDGRLVIVDLSAARSWPSMISRNREQHRYEGVHYDGARPAPNRGTRPRTSVEQQFCALGESAERFLVGAAAIGNTRLSSELEVLRALGAAQRP